MQPAEPGTHERHDAARPRRVAPGDSQEPRELVARIERSPELPEGDEERFNGYGVMSAPFRSGDILAMRRFPASSLGNGYTSVWHKAPDGTWTFWSDRDPLQACPRYFGSAITHAVTAAIELRWQGPRDFVVEIADANLRWEVELEASPATRMLNALGRRLSERMWRSKPMLTAMQWFAGELLQAGRLGLSGRAPNGQQFMANPMMVWTIPRSRASLGGAGDSRAWSDARAGAPWRLLDSPTRPVRYRSSLLRASECWEASYRCGEESALMAGPGPERVSGPGGEGDQ